MSDSVVNDETPCDTCDHPRHCHMDTWTDGFMRGIAREDLFCTFCLTYRDPRAACREFVPSAMPQPHCSTCRCHTPAEAPQRPKKLPPNVVPLKRRTKP